MHTSTHPPHSHPVTPPLTPPRIPPPSGACSCFVTAPGFALLHAARVETFEAPSDGALVGFLLLNAGLALAFNVALMLAVPSRSCPRPL